MSHEANDYPKMSKEHWEDIKERYCNECVTDLGGKHKPLRKIKLEPLELFEWFRKNLEI